MAKFAMWFFSFGLMATGFAADVAQLIEFYHFMISAH
jgi:hypothetical protein